MSNINVVGALKLAISKAHGTASKSILSGVPVELFTAVTSYENNRNVADRAIKQAKAGGAHMCGDEVAIVELNPEVNAALWARTEKLAAERGEEHTLPFIKADGHTRSYGWTTVSPFKKDHGAENLFKRPESLFVTVHKGLTDDQIFALVKEYCDGVSKANNRELQEMGMKKVEFTPTSDFVAKDSWKTAFRTIDRKWAKDTDAAIEHFKDALQAIDNLKIDTKNTTKKLSGVRAALLTTYGLCSKTKWKEFWSKFYSVNIKHEQINALFSILGELGTGEHDKALEMCEDMFKEFAGLVPVAEEATAE